jgi:hypothetical protein
VHQGAWHLFRRVTAVVFIRVGMYDTLRSTLYLI